MACFLVSAAEAVAVKTIEKHELKVEEAAPEKADEYKIPLSRKLRWLSNLLLGGSVLLLFEHIWHGEITAWFPFLTAMSSAGDMYSMFYELATVGVGMALAITCVWFIMCKVADRIVHRSAVPSGDTGVSDIQ